MWRASWLTLAAFIVAAGSVEAAPITFFGEDLNPNDTVPAGGSSATARASFLSNLSGGVGTEDFQSFPANSAPPLNLTFPGSTGNITATLTGSGNEFVSDDDFGGDQFATSKTNFFANVTDGFTINFSAPIAAFGFFGTDIGDVNGSLTLELTASGGGTTNITVPNTLDGDSGSLLFFGFIDSAQTYTSITFGNTAAGSDFFGFDDLTVGDIGQVVQPSAVPEPTSLALLGLGGIGLVGGRLRRRMRKSAA